MSRRFAMDEPYDPYNELGYRPSITLTCKDCGERFEAELSDDRIWPRCDSCDREAFYRQEEIRRDRETQFRRAVEREFKKGA